MKKSYIIPQTSFVEIKMLNMIANSEEKINKYNPEYTADDDEIR